MDPALARILAEEVRTESVQWIWPGRIAQGKITLLAGDPGIGKSMIALDIAARLSRGIGFPDIPDPWLQSVQRRLDAQDAHAAQLAAAPATRDPFADIRPPTLSVSSIPLNPPAPPGSDAASTPLRPLHIVGQNIIGSTLIFSAEDDWRDTILPRLKTAGADLSRIEPYGSLDKGCSIWQKCSLRNEIPLLEKWMSHRYGKTRLLILDPITACMEGIDQNSTAAVRQHLAPLAHLAARMNLAILGITHLNKARRSLDIYRTTGSLAVAAVARAVHFAIPGSNGGPCTLAPMKNNLAAPSDPLAYRITAGKVQWLGGLPPQVCPEQEADIFEKHDREMARDFLTQTLARGPKPGARVVRRARRQAISERTLRRAKAELGILSKRDGLKGWYWLLPTQSLPPRT